MNLQDRAKVIQRGFKRNDSGDEFSLKSNSQIIKDEEDGDQHGGDPKGATHDAPQERAHSPLISSYDFSQHLLGGD